MKQRDPGTQRELQLRAEHPKTEPGQASLGGGVVGKVVGRQQGAKPFPFMETIFSKNKQFQSRATGELPAPPGHVRLGGWHSKDRSRAVAREVMGGAGRK